jgi:hypothetical protein
VNGDLVGGSTGNVQSIEDGGTLIVAGIVRVDGLKVGITLAVGSCDHGINVAVGHADNNCVSSGVGSAEGGAEGGIGSTGDVAVGGLLEVARSNGVAGCGGNGEDESIAG